MSTKFSMIRVETLVICVIYSVKVKSNRLETGYAEFKNAHTLCSPGYELAGRGVFNSCQPEDCGEIDLKGLEINSSKVDDTMQLSWINAYVARSPVMEYNGCYRVNVPSKTLTQLDHWHTYTDNGVLKCSRFCKSTGYAQKGDIILLQEYTCYCIKKERFNKWLVGPVSEVSTSHCSKKCPGDKLDRCGPTDSVSAYKFTGSNGDGKRLGSTCFYTEHNRIATSIPKRINCLKKLKFKCQTVVAGDGFKNVTTNQCFQWRLNWYDADEKCLQLGLYLPTYTPSNHKCILMTDVDAESNWHNTFTKERIVWNTEKKPRFSHECLAIELEQNMTYKLIAANCKQNYKALCVKKSQTETTTILSSQQETTTLVVTSEDTTKTTTETTILSSHQETTTVTVTSEDTAKTTTDLVTVSSDGLSRPEDIKMTSSDSKDGLYVGPPLAVAGLIVSVIVIVVCMKRRRKRKTDENARNMSTVYYSTVPDEVTLEKASDNPHGDGNGACLLNETDVYNHLGDTDQQNHSDLTGPVYDHTGLKDNDQYDISIISEKRINKDGDDFNHYDLMQVSTDNNSVYDETKRKTNGDKNIVSIEIYDHAKQTENDYDTTDTQRQHEPCEHLNDSTYEQSGPCDHLNDPMYNQSGQCDHLNDPMYDQSGPCEHLNDPMYDQSGPCEHLNDPTYDQSGPLEAAIFEKCETKQSNTEEQ